MDGEGSQRRERVHNLNEEGQNDYQWSVDKHFGGRSDCVGHSLAFVAFENLGMDLSALFPCVYERQDWLSHNCLDIVQRNDVKDRKVVYLQNSSGYAQGHGETVHDDCGSNETQELRARSDPYVNEEQG